MAKQSTPKPTTKPVEALSENETLNGSNTLPASIEIAEGHTVQLGDVVMAAHQKSGLSVDAWNALSEEERDGLLNKVIADFKAEVALASLPADFKADLADAATAIAQGTAEALQERPVEGQWMIASPVLLVSAPGGPRRRAGLAFGPVAIELRYEELGPDPDATLEALRADPFLKIDSRYEDRPADND
ncbi:hypothetical protein [Rhizobium sp. CECT 9324]|uniref:hypothetical protein n=1 Tax=Rhizobium sp. CECT 9324 TaxID=2845820 RepID=UPI001E51CB11|nr:hypothetical protein [Rhizobium sp. CECT 9324]CAH0339578.1 hypothetical protein RHI9324_01229 [Rhizobium sp. CECT 9324]